jgi:hypothetical protein
VLERLTSADLRQSMCGNKDLQNSALLTAWEGGGIEAEGGWDGLGELVRDPTSGQPTKPDNAAIGESTGIAGLGPEKVW